MNHETQLTDCPWLFEYQPPKNQLLMYLQKEMILGYFQDNMYLLLDEQLSKVFLGLTKGLIPDHALKDL